MPPLTPAVIYEKELTVWLSLATKAAEQAGGYLKVRDRSATEVIAESKRDVKLQGDRGAEEQIVHILRQGSDADILSEERGLVKGSGITPGAVWIVDPLDGTVNFQRGVPLSCVSVALWIDREPALGVVYDFIRGELFAGIVGQGATLNGRPICVSSVTCRERAILCTGFPVSTDFSSGGIEWFVHQVRGFKKVRLFGSAALSLAYVASGRVDAYFERDIKIWDVAAGLALVKAAGGEVSPTEWNESSVITAYAGNAQLPPLT